MAAPSTERKPKQASRDALLQAALNTAIAEATPAAANSSTTAAILTPSASNNMPDKEGDLVRATITLREEDLVMLDRIEDYLRTHNRRTNLARAMLVQVAIRSVQIGPELLEIAQAVKAQDARGRKSASIHKV